MKAQRSYTTTAITKASVNPWFISGFVDAEGSFMVGIRKMARVRAGWSIETIFQIKLHKKDENLLRLIQAYFGGIGKVRYGEKDSCVFVVRSLDQILKVLIPFFDKYPLITKKYEDYVLFKEVIKIMSEKGHLTNAGLQAIVNIRATLNQGLTPVLKDAFPNATPVARPAPITISGQPGEVIETRIPYPEWVAGFTSGDGSFKIKLAKSSTHKSGFQVTLIFQLTLHSRDEQLMKSFIDYFGCGKYYSFSNLELGDYVCFKFSDIRDIIIPFFQKHKVIGVKLQDFLDWCLAVELVESGAHLTIEGLEQIRLIQSGMNRGRPYTEGNEPDDDSSN